MDTYNTEQIRNIVLISHTGAGKTLLSEAMLFQTKTVSRMGKIEDGSTTSDFDPDEIKRKSSVNTSLLPFVSDKYLINLLDTPGYPDFIGEVKAALSVVEGSIILVCAASGVEVGTELVWKYAEQHNLSSIFFINKMDRENADFYKTVEQIESKFGRKCIPIQVPIGAESSFQGVVDVLSPENAPSDLQDKISAYREKLIEAAAESDDNLTAKYLEGEELSEEEIRTGLKASVASGNIVPIMVGSVLQGKGITELIHAINNYIPSPKSKGGITSQNPQTHKEETLEPDATAPLSTLVFKTTADPYVGRLTYLRVYSGTLNSDSNIWNANKNKAERIGQLFRVRGKSQEPVEKLVAGDMGAVAKLAVTDTNDTLCNKEHSVVIKGTDFPKPTMSIAVYPKTKGDSDKMGPALARLVEEDLTLETYKDSITAETILSGMGEAHFEVAVDKMKRKFGVELRTETPKIPYKETLTKKVNSEYKHKKQTGGHGQYGHVLLEIEPMPRGNGFEFTQRVVGGSVPKNYIPAVEKGVLEALSDGVIAGYPVTDLRVTLYDGSSHPVDSSDMSFKIAALHAVKKGVNDGIPVLLEPIMNLQVTVPDTYTGDVMSDLNGKRARVQGMNPTDGSNVIEAQAPLAEIQKYAIDLRSITQGRGNYTMEFSHYEEVPAHLAQKIIEESKKESDKS